MRAAGLLLALGERTTAIETVTRGEHPGGITGPRRSNPIAVTVP